MSPEVARICQFFLRGRCSRQKCEFRHPIDRECRELKDRERDKDRDRDRDRERNRERDRERERERDLIKEREREHRARERERERMLDRESRRRRLSHERLPISETPCKFFLTTGCKYGMTCRYRHIRRRRLCSRSPPPPPRRRLLSPPASSGSLVYYRRSRSRSPFLFLDPRRSPRSSRSRSSGGGGVGGIGERMLLSSDENGERDRERLCESSKERDDWRRDDGSEKRSKMLHGNRDRSRSMDRTKGRMECSDTRSRSSLVCVSMTHSSSRALDRPPTSIDQRTDNCGLGESPLMVQSEKSVEKMNRETCILYSFSDPAEQDLREKLVLKQSSSSSSSRRSETRTVVKTVSSSKSRRSHVERNDCPNDEYLKQSARYPDSDLGAEVGGKLVVNSRPRQELRPRRESETGRSEVGGKLLVNSRPPQETRPRRESQASRSEVGSAKTRAESNSENELGGVKYQASHQERSVGGAKTTARKAIEYCGKKTDRQGQGPRTRSPAAASPPSPGFPQREASRLRSNSLSSDEPQVGGRCSKCGQKLPK